MKRLITMLTALGISVFSFAQMSGKVSGLVQDGNQKTIESATITLLKAKDSSVAKVAAADKTGKYEFENIADGKYFVSISAVGHQKGNSPLFEINS